jgi:hypothetical protein
MAVRAALRASDADRDHVAERLRKAAGEGRLRTEELEQRLENALSARTYGELDALLRDLPGRALSTAPRRSRDLVGRTLGITLGLALGVAVAIAVLFVVTGVFAGWLLWVLAGWFLLGRRRAGRCGHPRRARLGGSGHWAASSPRRYWA